jgi:hypothetical protein
MNPTPSADLETDPRFPSGKWTGFFVQPAIGPGKHMMELLLTFNHGNMTGEGRDWVGEFIIRGLYSLQDGKCHWTKRYLGKHDVFYQGFNEGKGIWGKWEIVTDGLHGGFHIWPEGMADPTANQLTAAAELPTAVTDDAEVAEPEGEPVGAEAKKT